MKEQEQLLKREVEEYQAWKHVEVIAKRMRERHGKNIRKIKKKIERLSETNVKN